MRAESHNCREVELEPLDEAPKCLSHIWTVSYVHQYIFVWLKQLRLGCSCTYSQKQPN